MLQVAAMQNAQSASTRSTTGSDDNAVVHDPFVLDHSGTVMNEDMYALA